MRLAKDSTVARSAENTLSTVQEAAIAVQYNNKNGITDHLFALIMTDDYRLQCYAYEPSITTHKFATTVQYDYGDFCV